MTPIWGTADAEHFQSRKFCWTVLLLPTLIPCNKRRWGFKLNSWQPWGDHRGSEGAQAQKFANMF